MLVKFENKSHRVKGLAFHHKRPWILASLHNGTIQLWDYRMGALVDKFEDHDGPVRGIDFHSSQPLFVSGGDDYKIKVWNYQLRRCLFNLSGHLDYIRTVQFHREYPWILSASDDQTIRIWNWQSRTCLSVLTGHNHYVMCAQFHPKDDLVLSASLDQTVRVWDVSGLRKKTVSIAGEYPGPQQQGLNGANDLFGGSDVVVKHVLEGHTRGVNWASFHPNLSLIVSGADDREVKLWRMNDAKAWEVDTMRGHINNVSCVVFHPKKELIISNSEDKSIRVWDISKQNNPINIRRDTDRYWILDAHPHLNLLAAGHDSGMVVFKLFRERPPLDADEKSLFYYKDQYIYEYNFKAEKERPILSTRRQGRAANGGGDSTPRSLTYNTSNKSTHCILICSEADASYELYTFAKNDRDEGQVAMHGYGKCAVFVSRDRFAVLDKSRQIWLKNLKNETKKKVSIPDVNITHIFSGGIGRLLIRSSDAMFLYDIQALKVVAEMPIQARHPVKYVVWSKDNKYLAMFSKASIYICSAKLEELCTVTENNRVKSGAWDSCGVFVYNTSTHIKYLLPNGDSGIIRTLDERTYITAVNDSTITYLDRSTNVGKLTIDATEYMFKVALMRKKNKDVFRIMQSKKLVGQSIISYLQQKGYPEVALHFVEDVNVKFSLALECGNIGVALDCATQLDSNECWHKLGVEALRQGNHQVVEAAYQKTKNFERLSFLYLITGNIEKLSKMLHIATLRGDIMGRFHNALYLGNVAERIAVLKDAGQLGLAYLTAKAHGLDEDAAALAEELGADAPELPNLSQAKLLFPPQPILKENNWPLLETRKNFMEQTDEAGESGDEPQEEAPDLGLGGGSDSEKAENDIEDWDVGVPEKKEEAGEAGGWDDDMDLGLDLGAEAEGAAEAADDNNDVFVMPLSGKSAQNRWVDNSTLVADLVAAGSFDQAMHVLHRSVGIVNFAPLKPLFMQIYNSTYCSLPQLPGSSSLVSPLQRNSDQGDKALPTPTFTLENCVEKLKNGYKAVTDGKFNEAQSSFESIFQLLPLLVVENSSQVKELVELRTVCQEYLLAMRIELERKNAKDPVRQAALSAYFTHCKLQPVHLVLALRAAIKCCYSIKCYKTTAACCRRILELAPSHPNVAKLIKLSQIRGVLKMCDKEDSEAHDLSFDETASFTICAGSFTPIQKEDKSSQCPFCGANFHGKFAGTLCASCQLGKVGAKGTGFTGLYQR